MKNKGFTLVEVIIVMTILSVLVPASIAGYHKYKKQALNYLNHDKAILAYTTLLPIEDDVDVKEFAKQRSDGYKYWYLKCKWGKSSKNAEGIPVSDVKTLKWDYYCMKENSDTEKSGKFYRSDRIEDNGFYSSKWAYVNKETGVSILDKINALISEEKLPGCVKNCEFKGYIYMNDGEPYLIIQVEDKKRNIIEELGSPKTIKDLSVKDLEITSDLDDTVSDDYIYRRRWITKE